MEVWVPGLRLRGINEFLHEHPLARSRRVKKECAHVGWLLKGRLGLDPPKPPLRITIERHGPKVLDDDGCTISAKWVRDEIARYLGLDDADPRLQWQVRQVMDRDYGVRITLDTMPLAA